MNRLITKKWHLNIISYKLKCAITASKKFKKSDAERCGETRTGVRRHSLWEWRVRSANWWTGFLA